MEIQSYRSVGPVQFGMSEDEVRFTLGEPASASKDRSGNRTLRYDGFNVTIGVPGVVEIGILPETPVTLSGVELFASPSALEAVCKMDGAPQECLGFLVFMKLGITMTGFHDHDESQKAVTAFVPGRWDSLKPQMKTFRLAL